MVSACTVATFYCTKRTVLACFWLCSDGRQLPEFDFHVLLSFLRMSVLKHWYRWPLSGNVSTVWVGGCRKLFLVNQILCQNWQDWHAGKYHSLFIWCVSPSVPYSCVDSNTGLIWGRLAVLCYVQFQNICQDGFLTRCMLSQLWWVGNKAQFQKMMVAVLGEQAGEMWTGLLWNTWDVFNLSHPSSCSHSTEMLSFETSQFKVIYNCEKPLFRLIVLYICL